MSATPIPSVWFKVLLVRGSQVAWAKIAPGWTISMTLYPASFRGN
jgi:hypothetical protein